MGAPLIIRVAGRSSRVFVTAVDRDGVHVDGGRVQQQADGSFDVSPHAGSRIEIMCPQHSAVTISTASGSVSVDGEVGPLHVVTASGRVEVARAADLEVRTSSGRVEIGHCQHNCRVTTQSGRIEVGTSGGVELSSTAGRVTVSETGRAVVRTVSGRIEIGATAAATVQAHTISGRVHVNIAGQSPARMQLATTSGRIEREVPDGDGGAHIEVTTTSGSIAIRRR
jgi:DUF4097 and DUF4098 domain-containing protein YvlB